VEKPGAGIQLLVEARNVAAPSEEWTIEFLRNLLLHARIPPSPYFLLALRNRLSDFEGSTDAALRPYLSRIALEKLSTIEFEMLIQAWLSDLVAGTLPEMTDRRWLEESGLAESARDGAIRSDLAA
jgi:hypothetical protein